MLYQKTSNRQEANIGKKLDILIIRLMCSKKYANYFSLVLKIHIGFFIATLACTGVKHNMFSGGQCTVYPIDSATDCNKFVNNDILSGGERIFDATDYTTDYSKVVLPDQNNFFIDIEANVSCNLQHRKVVSRLALYEAVEWSSLTRFQEIITRYSDLKLDLNAFVSPGWMCLTTKLKDVNMVHQLASHIIEHKNFLNGEDLVTYDWNIFECILINNQIVNIDITIQAPEGGNNILHRFAANGDFNAVNKLINLYKAYPNVFDLTKLLYATNYNHYTPLELAEQKKLELEKLASQCSYCPKYDTYCKIVCLLDLEENQFPHPCPIKCPEEKPPPTCCICNKKRKRANRGIPHRNSTGKHLAA